MAGNCYAVPTSVFRNIERLVGRLNDLIYGSYTATWFGHTDAYGHIGVNASAFHVNNSAGCAARELAPVRTAPLRASLCTTNPEN